MFEKLITHTMIIFELKLLGILNVSNEQFREILEKSIKKAFAF